MVSGWMVDRVLHRVGLCKTLIPGSNPGVASNDVSVRTFRTEDTKINQK